MAKMESSESLKGRDDDDDEEAVIRVRSYGIVLELPKMYETKEMPAHIQFAYHLAKWASTPKGVQVIIDYADAEKDW